MDTSEKLKQCKKLLSILNQGNYVLVVEGKRDKAALRNVGITCEVITATGKPEHIVNKIVQLCVNGTKPALLFDFDEAGEEHLTRLTELCLASDCIVDVNLRKKFKLIFGMRCFEEVDNRFEKILQESE